MARGQLTGEEPYSLVERVASTKKALHTGAAAAWYLGKGQGICDFRRQRLDTIGLREIDVDRTVPSAGQFCRHYDIAVGVCCRGGEALAVPQKLHNLIRMSDKEEI